MQRSAGQRRTLRNPQLTGAWGNRRKRPLQPKYGKSKPSKGAVIGRASIDEAAPAAHPDTSTDVPCPDSSAGGLRGADEGLCTSRLPSTKLHYATAWDFDIAVTNLHDSRPMVVKKLMGHSSITTTQKYLHTLPNADGAAVSTLDTIRKRATT